jgi:hypothetical protein
MNDDADLRKIVMPIIRIGIIKNTEISNVTGR